MVLTYKEKLLNIIISKNTVPDGGGFGDVIEFFSNNKKRNDIIEKSKNDLNSYIKSVKSTKDNPYKNDEEICRAILDEVQNKERRS